MPGSPTAPGRPGACNCAPVRISFHQQNCVGTQIDVAFAAQWLAYVIPYRRFAHALTVADARLHRAKSQVCTRLPAGGRWNRTSGSGASGEADAILPVKDQPR